MVKLSKEEIKFLQNHRQDLLDSKFQEVFDGFGDDARLRYILKDIGIVVPSDIVSNDKRISFISIGLPSPEIFEEDDVASYLYRNLSDNNKSAWTDKIHNVDFIQVANFYPGRASFGGNFPYNIKTQVLPVVEVKNLRYPKFTKLDISGEQWFVLDDNHIMYLGPTVIMKFDDEGSRDYNNSSIKRELEEWLPYLKQAADKVKVIE